jgi:hypothetical protein
MDEIQKQHLSIVNSSGFPFQIAVTQAINGNSKSLWQVVFQEHPWRHPDTHQEGYIDLVLENKYPPEQRNRRLILECKRQGGNPRWYFLNPDGGVKAFRYLACESHVSAEPCDGIFEPESAEAAYCVIPGEGGGGRQLLEKMIDELLQSLEAFAMEEHRLNQGSTLQWLYMPVIVTSAKLFTCKFNAANVSLETGKVPDDACVEEVPFIRFRKTLWSHKASEQAEGLSTIRKLHLSRERTVWVVSGSSLNSFLEQVWPSRHLY